MSGPAAFRRLFEPLTIGTFTIRNRIVNTAHLSTLPRERDLEYLRRRARGGVGLLGLSGGTAVGNYALGPGTAGGVSEWDRKPPSPVTDDGVAFYDEFLIPYLRERVDLIHAEGARCFGQVAHGGAGQHWPSIAPAIGPFTVPDDYDARVPHPLAEGEIEELIFAFAQGIRRIFEAGMDAAEIHGAHGYLVMQFLSPHTNRRTDRWGGSLENRARLIVEIIEAARTYVGPDFPIGLRLGFDGDSTGRGLTIDAAARTARLLAPHLAWVSVSGGSYSGLDDGYRGAYVSPWYRAPAHNAEAATAVRAASGLPVIVTGRISDPSTAESLLGQGAADMIGMVRALIADPELPVKARTGRSGEVRMCLGLSECHHIGRHRVAVTCAVNASAGREDELTIEPAAEPKTVVVVGAGPAGLEAARVAALRGHKVYLGDARREVGGTVRVLGRDPNRRNLLDHAVFFESALAPLDVELVLGHEVSAEDILAFEADAVVLATGGRAVVPDVVVDSGAAVLTALEVLGGAAPPTHDVLVVGGVDNHLAAPTVAEFLTDRGHLVEMISEQVDFAAGAEDGTRIALLKRLRSKGVTISLCTRLAEVDAKGATLVDTFAERDRRRSDVTIVLACGLVPNDDLRRELGDRVPRVQLIGDALAPRRIMHATVEGARAALAI